MHVLLARATRLPFSSRTSRSTSPTVLPRLTTRASGRASRRSRSRSTSSRPPAPTPRRSPSRRPRGRRGSRRGASPWGWRAGWHLEDRLARLDAAHVESDRPGHRGTGDFSANHRLDALDQSRHLASEFMHASSPRVQKWIRPAGLGLDSSPMAPGSSAPKPSADAERQLAKFIAKFEPKHRALIGAVRRALRRRLPAANELVWDNYNFFVIGYSATERPSDSVLSLAAGAKSVGLSFYRGASLPDPHGILLGEGKQNRFIRLESARVFSHAPGRSSDRGGGGADEDASVEDRPGRLIVRSVSAKQRPRAKRR